MIMGLINYAELIPVGTSNRDGNLKVEEEIELFARYKIGSVSH